MSFKQATIDALKFVGWMLVIGMIATQVLKLFGIVPTL